MKRIARSRRFFHSPPYLRSTTLQIPARPFSSALPRLYETPRITRSSFWISLIPKPLRRGDPSLEVKNKRAKPKDWNPATFFILIFLLIGSMSIQMIAMRNEFATFTRRADAKIGLLKEIIERIQKGEDVDVEGLLGTGDKEREKEWEEVIKEIEQEDEAWEKSRSSKPKHGRNLEAQEESSMIPPPQIADRSKDTRVKSEPPSGFY